MFPIVRPVPLDEVFTVRHGKVMGAPAYLLVRMDGHTVGYRRTADDMQEWLATMPVEFIERHAGAIQFYKAARA